MSDPSINLNLISSWSGDTDISANFCVMDIISKHRFVTGDLNQKNLSCPAPQYSIMQNLQLNYENRIFKVICRIHPRLHLLGNKEFQSWGKKRKHKSLWVAGVKNKKIKNHQNHSWARRIWIQIEGMRDIYYMNIETRKHKEQTNL